MRSLVVGPTLALVALTSSPASGPVPLPRGRAAEGAKLAAQPISIESRGPAPGKDEACCGYPLVRERGFGLRFYWLAHEDRFEPEDDHVAIYSRDGFFIGAYPAGFIKSLLMEGSGILSDGRVLNYSGRCRFGVGTCYEWLDETEYPFGRGAGRRALVPFKSVAVDPRLVPIGEPLYIPEFDGLVMPDGSVHDGCVRADDTGGNIKKREMDFFVVSYDNFRLLLDSLSGVIWVTPHIENPRCAYLRAD
ncbi:MAG TPA: 3D domain-containing protein [Kofleriaceae bacterium]|nr:3D domain-containing protein [Kofleriaceae bacterium]